MWFDLFPGEFTRSPARSYHSNLTINANTARGSTRLEYNLNGNWSIFWEYTAHSLRLPSLWATQDFWRTPEMFVTHEPKANDLWTSRVKINLKEFSIFYGLMIQIHLLLKSIIATISETWILQGWIQNVKFLGETSLEWLGGEVFWKLFQKIG